MKEKIVYNYDADTKIYIGSEVCNEDPLDGGYLIPANCTETAPKLENNKIPVFENGDWVNKSNNVRKYRVLDNQPVEIKELGDFDYILTDEQLKEIQCGKLVKIENNEIVIYDKEKTIKEQIQVLEAQITPRRMREYAMGIQESIEFVNNIDAQVKELRTKIAR